jgi:methionine-rich copper-binding protein CopC
LVLVIVAAVITFPATAAIAQVTLINYLPVQVVLINQSPAEATLINQSPAQVTLDVDGGS